MKNNVGTICRRQFWEVLRRNGFTVAESDIKVSKRDAFHLFVFCSHENSGSLIVYPSEIFECILQKEGFICVRFHYQYLCSLINIEEVNASELYKQCWNEDELFSSEHQVLSMMYALQLQYQQKPSEELINDEALSTLLWKICACDLYHESAQKKYLRRICGTIIKSYNHSLFFMEQTVSKSVFEFSRNAFFLLYSLIMA